MVKRFTLFALVICLIATSALQAEDWPTYRYDRLRTASTPESLTLPLQESWHFQSRQAQVAPHVEDQPHWQGYPEDMEYSLPIIAAGDFLYFTSSQDGRVVALDAATGQTKWEFITGAGVNCTPMHYQSRLYFGSEDGNVYCLDAITGETVWVSHAAPSDRMFIGYGKMLSVWAVKTDVFVDDGVCYFASGVFPHDGSFVTALDAESGELIYRSAQVSENGWRNSLAPGGHLFVTRDDVWVPKDFLGYSGVGYGAGLPFRRSDGVHTNAWGTPNDEFKAETHRWWPVMGAVHEGVRYQGNSAFEADGERKELWRQEIEGRIVDIDTAMGVRMGGKHGYPVVMRYDPNLCSVIYAGGTVFYTAFDNDPTLGNSGLYARNPADGELLWETEIPGYANQVIAANGRLFVSTRDGNIYCFSPQGAEQHGLIEEAVEESPIEVSPEMAAAAEAILQATELENGYALVLDCQDAQLPYELARRSNLYVCATYSDADALAEARAVFTRAGMHTSRIVARLVEPGGHMPFPSNFADVVVSAAAIRGEALPTNIEEVTRMTKPIRGITLMSGKAADSLDDWVTATGQEGWEMVEYAGSWAKRVQPALEGAGSWSHMYGDPGNSGSSHDAALKPPLGMVWYGPPFIRYGTDQTPLIVNGILVSPDANSLEGYDQYTGRKLWRLEAGGIGVGRGRLAASDDSIYVIWDKVIIKIDLESGEELGGYMTAFGEEHAWSWMGVDPDGTKVYGAGAGGIWATEMETGQGNILWQIGGPDAMEQYGGQMAMSDGKIYVLGGEVDDAMRNAALAEMRAWFQTQPQELRDEFESQLEERDIRKLTCIDCETGDVLWQHGVDLSNAGGRWMRPVGFGARRGYNPHLGGGMYVNNGVVVFGSEGGADKGWSVFYTGAYEVRALNAYDGETGNHLWYQFANYRARPVLLDDWVIAEPWAYDLRTGDKIQREHPVTGEMEDWAWCRADKQCGIFAASKYFIFGRSMGIGYQDIYSDQGLYTIWHSRASCWIDCSTGGGMMIKPPQSLGCQCQWNMPFTIAMGTVDSEPSASPAFAQPGEGLPVKHLYLNFAATGDRRDEAGNLWVRSDMGEHPLLFGYPMVPEYYEGKAPVQRSTPFTSIEGTDLDFVFATAARGYKKFELPVTTEDGPARNYTLRLGFSAPPGDVAGQRVFNVTVNGQPFLENFDIVAEAGGVDIAIWRELEVNVQGKLTIEFTAAAGDAPTLDQMPLISALELLRDDVEQPSENETAGN